MSWPRKNEGCRLYQERQTKSYILVIIENGRSSSGHWDAVGNVMNDSKPCLAGCSASDMYLHNRCKRVQWSDLSEEWKNAFLAYMGDWDQKQPEQIRGLWRHPHAVG